MTAVLTETEICSVCNSELIAESCLNVDCASAQDFATRDADRKTAKATVKDADRMLGAPRAFTSSGRVD